MVYEDNDSQDSDEGIYESENEDSPVKWNLNAKVGLDQYIQQMLEVEEDGMIQPQERNFVHEQEND